MKDKIKSLYERFEKANEKKQNWESHWDECYSYSFPQRENVVSSYKSNNIGDKKNTHLYDGTAPDAVDQLAASLLAELTPPWSKWFGFKAGKDLSKEEKDNISPELEKITETMSSNFDYSNFSVEIHQCYLDLVVAGTACLMFEEAPIGESSAFRFYAVPLKEIAVEENSNGKIDTTFRESEIGLEGIKSRFPEAKIPNQLIEKMSDDFDYKAKLIEAVIPKITKFGVSGYEYIAFIWDENTLHTNDNYIILREGNFETSPFINFRWLKAPGEIYGRSPVMKTLPDIKTVNKVVELVLKNASISVTGIWQADDDGVLNPANIKLVPGSIIPKAIGSKGLTPLEAPGNFDVSQLLLDDLRKRIRHSLLTDRLSQIDTPTMTATEVLERSEQMVRILGASFGRLQSELLTPLMKRAFYILKRRGEIPPLSLDGRTLDLQYKSPLALSQSQKDASNVINWIQTVSSFAPTSFEAVDIKEATRWLGRTLNVPESLIVEAETSANPIEDVLANLQENPELLQSIMADVSNMTNGEGSEVA